MAYYNMDKRSDGVRCRRSLSAANRLDPSSTPGLLSSGLKEDKIRFLLEAAEAARGGGGGPSTPRPAVPPPAPPGPFAGMSLGQYVNALSSCLPSKAWIRPLLWSPAQPFQPLPHDGVTSHAALLSTLAAAPLQSVQDSTSTPAQGIPDRSMMNSLLASFATGSPLFSINGLSSKDTAGPGSADVVGTSLLRYPSSEGLAVPQDLSMSGARTGSDSKCSGSETDADSKFLSSVTTTLGTEYPSKDGLIRSPGQREAAFTGKPADFRASDNGAEWPGGLPVVGAVSALKQEDEATDLSVRSAEASFNGYQKSPGVLDATVGTVDLSSRGVDRKPRVSSPRPITNGDGGPFDRPGDYKTAGSSGCCGDNAATCPHLLKLKELRRNVYRMLSVFTPYLDVAGAGIADVEADAVDDFLHEVIYSSKLDQGTN